MRCRFFLTGPAFLPGLQAHFNAVSYEAHERSERHNDLHEEVTLMENRRADCERDRQLFTETRELERLSQRYEAETEAMGMLVNDMQATHYLIARSLEIMKDANKDGVQLVAFGEMSDIKVAFTETPSELHQIEVLCENAVIYPEIDALQTGSQAQSIARLHARIQQDATGLLPPEPQAATGGRQRRHATHSGAHRLTQGRTGVRRRPAAAARSGHCRRDLGRACRECRRDTRP
ncbi:hypothetical protein LP414_08555 [Polaromonas sp. P1(28)-13]|nr:hypothetical protein LP414_08555 [Polaromonas sp. P1(28)-13]